MSRKPLWKEIKDAFFPDRQPWYRSAWENIFFLISIPFWIFLYLCVAVLYVLVFLATFDKWRALDAWEDLTP